MPGARAFGELGERVPGSLCVTGIWFSEVAEQQVVSAVSTVREAAAAPGAPQRFGIAAEHRRAGPAQAVSSGSVGRRGTDRDQAHPGE
ncbi:hypothetical protein GCM10017668_08350 [Streptomyces tuirus]|uniref:Uncharacterized protein n=1 Tax=Streptomyces tuirus TaxID=68278 RepID=A0A7G1N9R9_9ACTN|nr:hypothetical protein GCM10017668_08350 [Streptomyces tuirus]